MIEAVVFDFDGTLANTAGDIHASVNYVIEKYYGPQYKITLKECINFVGRGLRNELKSALTLKNLEFTEDFLDEGLEVLEAYYANHPCDFTVAYEGVETVLKSLSQRGVKLGVYSNKADDLLKSVVRKVFPTIKFDFVCGLQKALPRKPAPDGIFLFMNQYDLKAANLVYVGDSEVDFQTGENAKVDTKIVTWGFRSKDELKAQLIPSECFVDTIDELKAVLGG